jgi:hypothetical protein
VPGRVLVDNLAAALPDHAQHGAALGRPAAGDAQQQADPSRQSLRQHRSRAARLDPGGRIGAAPRRDDRRGSHGRRGAIRCAGDVDDGCRGCFGNFGFPPTAVVHSRFGERRESTLSCHLLAVGGLPSGHDRAAVECSGRHSCARRQRSAAYLALWEEGAQTS